MRSQSLYVKDCEEMESEQRSTPRKQSASAGIQTRIVSVIRFLVQRTSDWSIPPLKYMIKRNTHTCCQCCSPNRRCIYIQYVFPVTFQSLKASVSRTHNSPPTLFGILGAFKIFCACIYAWDGILTFHQKDFE